MLSIAMRGSLVALGFSAAVAGCGGDDGGADGSRDGRPSSAAGLFRELERRPLDLPRVDLGGRSIREYGVAGRCVEGRGTEVNAIELRAVVPTVAALGPWPPGRSHTRGPVYAALPEGAPRIVILAVLPTPRGSGGWLARTLWISRPGYDGPLLVRGGRLDRPGALGFGAGLPPRESLRLPAGGWAGIGVESRGEGVDAREGWRVAAVPTRIRGPGCYAFRVDGLGFSYVLAFGVQAD